jgi:hypothetical protein
MSWSKNVSPVGWYVGSYLLRFVELAQEGNDDPEKRFLTWENTILVRATDLDEAYDKIVECARLSTNPYKGGPQVVDVQWVFEGVTAPMEGMRTSPIGLRASTKVTFAPTSAKAPARGRRRS